MSDKLPGNFVSEIDQAIALAASIGEMIAAYYQSLIDNKVPVKVAAEMAREFQSLYWTHILNQSRQS